MATYQNLTNPQKDLVMKLFATVVNTVAPDDPTGHIPNCGFDEDGDCGCADYGMRLRQALVEDVATVNI